MVGQVYRDRALAYTPTSLTTMLVTLTAHVLAVWVHGGAQWNSGFSRAQLRAAFEAAFSLLGEVSLLRR